MKARTLNTRTNPGTRPSEPVRSIEPPDCELCTWAFRQAVWSLPEGQEQAGVWELKYLNAMCFKHARLAAA